MRNMFHIRTKHFTTTGKVIRGAIVATALAWGIPAKAQDVATSVNLSLDGLAAEGASLYRLRCAKCHGQNGEGERHGHDAAPRLGGNFARLSVRAMAVQIIFGGAYMPPFGSLTDREIAAVATYVRTSFGNDLGIATQEDIATFR